MNRVDKLFQLLDELELVIAPPVSAGGAGDTEVQESDGLAQKDSSRVTSGKQRLGPPHKMSLAAALAAAMKYTADTARREEMDE